MLNNRDKIEIAVKISSAVFSGIRVSGIKIESQPENS